MYVHVFLAFANHIFRAKRSLLSWKLLGDNRHLISYSDLGFYQLLFEIPTASVMREYTARFLDPIREYDKTHDAHLYERLPLQ